ncbi:MAG: hypothetical protein AAFX99_14790 [Myxococcota bacterium]
MRPLSESFTQHILDTLTAHMAGLDATNDRLVEELSEGRLSVSKTRTRGDGDLPNFTDPGALSSFAPYRLRSSDGDPRLMLIASQMLTMQWIRRGDRRRARLDQQERHPRGRIDHVMMLREKRQGGRPTIILEAATHSAPLQRRIDSALGRPSDTAWPDLNALLSALREVLHAEAPLATAYRARALLFDLTLHHARELLTVFARWPEPALPDIALGYLQETCAPGDFWWEVLTVHGYMDDEDRLDWNRVRWAPIIERNLLSFEDRVWTLKEDRLAAQLMVKALGDGFEIHPFMGQAELSHAYHTASRQAQIEAEQRMTMPLEPNGEPLLTLHMDARFERRFDVYGEHHLLRSSDRDGWGRTVTVYGELQLHLRQPNAQQDYTVTGSDPPIDVLTQREPYTPDWE